MITDEQSRVQDLLHAISTEMPKLTAALDEAWPTWFEETLATLDDGTGRVNGKRSLPIMAAIKLIEDSQSPADVVHPERLHTFADRLSAAYWEATDALPDEAKRTGTRADGVVITSSDALRPFLDIIGDLYRASSAPMFSPRRTGRRSGRRLWASAERVFDLQSATAAESGWVGNDADTDERVARAELLLEEASDRLKEAEALLHSAGEAAKLRGGHRTHVDLTPPDA